MKNKEILISIVLVGLLMMLPFPLYEYGIISKSIGLISQIISIVLAAILIFYSNYKYNKKYEK